MHILYNITVIRKRKEEKKMKTIYIAKNETKDHDECSENITEVVDDDFDDLDWWSDFLQTPYAS